MKTNNYVIITILIMIFGSIIYGNIAGKRQNAERYNDNLQYKVSLEELQKNNIDVGINSLLDLSAKYPDNYLLLRYLGLSYGIKEDYQTAASYYQRVVDQRPFIVMDPSFSLQYGQILYNLKAYSAAKQYFEHSKTLGGSEDYLNQVEELLRLTNEELQ
jgi:tetratricopeptide (TPR) repeat protein